MKYLADGYRVAIDAAVRGCRPDPALHIDQWSEEFMVVSDGNKKGRYRISHTPMARRVLQVLSPRHRSRRVVVKGASQMLKTQVALCFLMASAHRAPDNMLVLEPTDHLAKRVSARVSRAIRDVPELQSTFAKARSRDNRNTVFTKDFLGGTMYIATAGSAANLAELAARYIYVDEIDRLALNVDGEGDPVLLAENRGTVFEDNAKFLHTSSPGLTGQSKIDVLFDMGTQEVYRVPCPHCDHHHELVIANFRFQRDSSSGFMHRAWFVCPDCGAEIDERYKARMLRDAEMGGTAHWHASSVGDGETVSFHVSAFYAPVGSISWLKLAREFARAKERLDSGDPEAMKVFYNTRLALSWENALERTTAQQLQARQLDDPVPPRVVPDRALVVTLSVDTQPNRLEVQAEAWGPDLEHWVIDYEVFMGSPTEAPTNPTSVWARLDAYRREPFMHASGVLIPASCYGIDSGGANTQDVYNYGQARAHVGCVILRGASKPDRPIINSTPSKVDIDWDGRRIDGGALLWSIGTDVAKDHLFNRFKLRHGGGAMHFHSRLPLNWFEGLLSERPVLKRKPGGGFRRAYEKSVERNEPLDLAVYNLAMAHHLGLHKWSPHDWAKLRAKLIPAQVTPDLFAMPPADPPPAPGALPEAEPAPEPQPVPVVAEPAPQPVAAPAAPALAMLSDAPVHAPAHRLPAQPAPIAAAPAAPPFAPSTQAAPARRMLSRGI